MGIVYEYEIDNLFTNRYGLDVNNFLLSLLLRFIYLLKKSYFME